MSHVRTFSTTTVLTCAAAAFALGAAPAFVSDAARRASPTAPVRAAASEPVKYFSILRRKPGMSVTEFRAHWRTVHGPLNTRIPGVLRYYQHYPVAGWRLPARPGFPNEETPVDGIAEVWWESDSALARAQGTPAFRAITADEPKLFGPSDRYDFIVRVERTVRLK